MLPQVRDIRPKILQDYRDPLRAGQSLVPAGRRQRRRPDPGRRHRTGRHLRPGAQDGIDAAYHAKYDRYGPQIVGSVTGPGAYDVTVRLLPQPGGER